MSFTAQHMSVSQTMRLSAPPSQVFPLLDPIGEKNWAKGWEPQMLFPADGTPQVGAVFTTQEPSGDEAIWTMIAYDPAQLHIAYLRVEPGLLVSFIEIQCDAAQDRTASVTVTYTRTGLSEAGNDRLARFSAQQENTIVAWEGAINFYLAHGHALSHH
jgi:hypothetical protein